MTDSEKHAAISEIKAIITELKLAEARIKHGLLDVQSARRELERMHQRWNKELPK